MVLGIGLRDVISLARETQSAPRRSDPIVVDGVRASDVAEGLRRDGDSSLVRVGGGLGRAAAYVIVVECPATASQELRLREATRAGIPIVGVRLGAHDAPLPYVLPGDIIDVEHSGDPLPFEELTKMLAAVLAHDGVSLAARLPVLRPAVEQRRMLDSALAAASIAAFSRSRKRPLLPVIALAQARTLRELAVARGDQVPSAPADMARTAGPELVAALAVGVACRALVRRLPVRGRLVEGLVAGAGTFALTALARRLPSL